MTMNEFKAWLEGFEASFTNEAPSKEQWAAVKAKLQSVAPAAVNKIAAPNIRDVVWPGKLTGDPVPMLPYTST